MFYTNMSHKYSEKKCIILFFSKWVKKIDIGLLLCQKMRYDVCGFVPGICFGTATGSDFPESIGCPFCQGFGRDQKTVGIQFYV